MNNPKLKASELIKKECCSIGLLSIEKAELVKMVEKLEHDKCVYFNALKEIQNLPCSNFGVSSDIAFRAIKACGL